MNVKHDRIDNAPLNGKATLGHARIALLLFLALLPSLARAQRLVSVSGEYEYVMSDETRREAEARAVERARIAALVKAFNETMYQNNSLISTNRNGRGGDDFYSVSGSEVRGEWIEDTKPPLIEVKTVGDEIVIKATVWGRAREVLSAGTQLSVTPLRNGTDARFASLDFVDGDDFYLRFAAPQDGYVCVFLIEPDEHTVSRLLPYQNDGGGSFAVKGGRQYLFFKNDPSREEGKEADEIVLTCNRAFEHNELCVVFSPHKFSKPIDSDAARNGSSGLVQPAYISLKAFNKWLSSSRSKDRDMTVHRQTITIRKPSSDQ